MRGLVTFVLVEYEYKQKFEHIFQLFSSGLIFFNGKGEILEVNSQIEEIFQINRTELIGMNVLSIIELFKGTSFTSEKEFLKELIHHGEAEFKCEMQTFLGEPRYIYIRVSKQKDANMYLTVVEDESEKVHLKQRLDHTESLSTLGQLAASIAHEIRNPMTSLKGFTQLLYKTATEDSRRYLSVIDDEIKRMEEILTEFLEVSKPTEYKYTYFDVQDLVTEVANFMAPQALMQQIELIIQINITSARKIFADRSLLKQVFMNSIKNAIEVMPNGGTINILINDLVANYVTISIEDQGCGIDQDNLKKIFNPFFTTKSAGTGLGLSHAKEVIEKHNGTIEVESAIGQGTTFKYIIPTEIGY